MRFNKTNIQARLKVLEDQIKQVDGTKVVVYQYMKDGTIIAGLSGEDKTTFKNEKDFKAYHDKLEKTCDLLILIRDVDEAKQE